MEKIKVMSVFGTRPETIKMAPLVKELGRREEFESLVCVTAQHRQMLDQVLEAFGITPDYDLDIMKPGQTLSDITARVLQGLEKVIQEVSRTWFWFTGTPPPPLPGPWRPITARRRWAMWRPACAPMTRYSPFPEEMNRQFVGCVADLHFAPTQGARDNPAPGGQATGDYCGHRQHRHRRPENHRAGGLLRRDFGVGQGFPAGCAHRPPAGEPGSAHAPDVPGHPPVVEEFPDVKVVYPVHLNPLVQKAAEESWAAVIG